MNSNRKRILAISLMATVVAATLSACTPTTEQASTEPASTTDTEATTETEEPSAEPSGDVQEISFWNIGTQDPDKDLWQWAIDQYNADNPDSGYVVKETTTQNDQYKQKLIVAMSAGECPDMYIHWSGGPMNEYVDSGFAQPITDLMASSGVQDKLLDGAIAQASYNGEIYSVPIIDCSVAGIFYNKEIYDTVGLSIPTTMAELEANSDALVAAGYIPFSLANASQWTGSMYYMYFVTRYAGLDPFANAVAGTGSFEDEAFIYAGEKIQEWVDAGYFPQGVNGLDEDAGQSKQLMYTEEAAMQLHGSWQASRYLADSPEFYEKIGWFPVPGIEGGYEDDSILVGTIGGNFVSFNCTGDMLEEAFKCVTYYSSDEWEQLALEAGKIPPLKGSVSEDPVMQSIGEAIENASSIQLWYDQYLPNELAEVHKAESQKLFDHSATPEEVAAAQQAAMDAYNEGN